ncbi:MAG: antibiotic biosynthesis monooxygenase [Myxococcota bacterium]
MHAFLTHMRAKPGKRDEVLRLTTEMLEQTQAEAGIPVYIFSTAKDSPDDFYFYDLYESDAARTAHESTEKFKQTMPALMEVADFVGVTVLEPYGPMKITPPGR